MQADEIDLIRCFQGFYLFPATGGEPEREGIVLLLRAPEAAAFARPALPPGGQRGRVTT